MKIKIIVEVNNVMYTDRYEVLAHKLLEQLRPWRKNIGLTRKDGNNYITYSIKVNNK